MDDGGRVRLPGRFIDDFVASRCETLVLYGLPEGAVALYPEQAYLEMRQAETTPPGGVLGSFVARRSLRRFGAMTASVPLTRQGRITVPELLREYADLAAGRELCVIGVEIGVELWNPERYRAEMEQIRNHWQSKDELEMEGDLTS